MEYLEDILELAKKEFADIVRNGKFKSYDEIHAVYELVDVVKDIHCIWAYEEDEDGYSEMPRSRRGYSSSYYDDDVSYARGRGAKRNSMGRYSRSGEDAKQDFINDLSKLMRNAPNEEARDKIQSLIQHMER